MGLVRIRKDLCCIRLCKANHKSVSDAPILFDLRIFIFYEMGERKAGRFIVNKVRRLIVPFFAIGMMWMIPIKLLLRYPHYEGRSYLGALFMLLNGSDVGHLWYLPTLFLIFIIAYFLISILGNSKTVWTIALIVTLVISAFEKQMPSFGIIYLSNTYRYAWGFVFGAFIYKTELENIQKSITWISIGIALFSSTYYIYVGRTTSTIAPISILLSIYLVMTSKQYRIFDCISDNSFGIYLFHSPLIYITFTYLLNANPAIVSTVNFVVFGGVAFLITYIIKKTPLKIIIGEK